MNSFTQEPSQIDFIRNMETMLMVTDASKLKFTVLAQTLQFAETERVVGFDMKVQDVSINLITFDIYRGCRRGELSFSPSYE